MHLYFHHCKKFLFLSYICYMQVKFLLQQKGFFPIPLKISAYFNMETPFLDRKCWKRRNVFPLKIISYFDDCLFAFLAHNLFYVNINKLTICSSLKLWELFNLWQFWATFLLLSVPYGTFYENHWNVMFFSTFLSCPSFISYPPLPKEKRMQEIRNWKILKLKYRKNWKSLTVW